jgi:hypothetical protein
LRRGLIAKGLKGDAAVVVMVSHTGDYEWAAVFNEQDDDARVYFIWEEEDGDAWALTAPTIGMFFWDLAQTGLSWYEDKYPGNKPLKKTDIGLALDR